MYSPLLRQFFHWSYLLDTGGLDNVAMTFGGQWDGKGSKFNVKSWDKSPQLVSSSISKDPQRVSHRIWSILSSKGECQSPDMVNPLVER